MTIPDGGEDEEDDAAAAMELGYEPDDENGFDPLRENEVEDPERDQQEFLDHTEYLKHVGKVIGGPNWMDGDPEIGDWRFEAAMDPKKRGAEWWDPASGVEIPPPPPDDVPEEPLDQEFEEKLEEWNARDRIPQGPAQVGETDGKGGPEPRYPGWLWDQSYQTALGDQKVIDAVARVEHDPELQHDIDQILAKLHHQEHVVFTV
eukprot:gene19899-26602_t